MFRWRKEGGSSTVWVGVWVTRVTCPTWTGPPTPSTSAATLQSSRFSSGTQRSAAPWGTQSSSATWPGPATLVQWAGAPWECGARARTPWTWAPPAGTTSASCWRRVTERDELGFTPSPPRNPRAFSIPTRGTATPWPGSPGWRREASSSPPGAGIRLSYSGTCHRSTFAYVITAFKANTHVKRHRRPIWYVFRYFWICQVRP